MGFGCKSLGYFITKPPSWVGWERAGWAGLPGGQVIRLAACWRIQPTLTHTHAIIVSTSTMPRLALTIFVGFVVSFIGGTCVQGSGKELIQPVLDNQLKAASPLALPAQVEGMSGLWCSLLQNSSCVQDGKWLLHGPLMPFA